MKKKTLIVFSFILLFIVVFISSFLGWTYSQFNESKFEEKVQYYFAKNFPEYEIHFGKVEFKLRKTIRYNVSEISIVNSKNKKEIIHVKEGKILIPIESLFGGQTVSIYFHDYVQNFEKYKSFNDFWYPVNKEKDTRKYDLPLLLTGNSLTLNTENLMFTFEDDENSITINKFLAKNVNLESLTALELVYPLSNINKDTAGVLKLFGEFSLNEFIESKDIKFEGYGTFYDFKKESLLFLNGMRFKIDSASVENSMHEYKVEFLEGQKLVGNMTTKFYSDGISLSNISMAYQESGVNNFFNFGEFYPCSYEGESKISGQLNWNSTHNMFIPKIDVSNSCFQLTLKFETNNENPLYKWKYVFSKEKNLNVVVDSRELSSKVNSIENVNVVKDYFVFEDVVTLKSILAYLNKNFASMKNIAEEISFPITLKINQVHHDGVDYVVLGSGAVSRNILAFEKLSVSRKKRENLEAKFHYEYVSEDQQNYTANVKIKNFPSEILKKLFVDKEIVAKGMIKKGEISFSNNDNTFESQFELDMTKGEVDWNNIKEAINVVVDKKDGTSKKLSWTDKFQKLQVFGKKSSTEMVIDYKFIPNKEYFPRSGQVRTSQEEAVYKMDIHYFNAPYDVKKYLIKNFGKDELNLKFSKDTEFKVITE